MAEQYFIEYKDTLGRVRSTKPTDEDTARSQFKAIPISKWANLIRGTSMFKVVVENNPKAELDMIRNVILPSHIKKVADINKAINACNERIAKLEAQIKECER